MAEALSPPIDGSIEDASAPQCFDGWRVAFACAVAQALGVGMVAICGFMFGPIIAEFGASDAQMGFAMSITIFAMAALGPLLDRGPIKRIMLFGVAIMLGSSWAMAQATLQGDYVAAFLGLAGLLVVASAILAFIRIPKRA